MILIFTLRVLFTLQISQIDVYFFYTPDCGHCMDILLEDIPRLQSKYHFILKKYDINLSKNYRLLEEMEQGSGETGEDLPIIFVNDSVFYGPSEAREKLEATLKLVSKRVKPIYKDTASVKVDTAVPEIGKINLYYFYQPGCKECSRLEILLNGLQKSYENLVIHRLNTYEDTNKIIFEAFAEKNNIPQEKRLIVPTIVIGERYLIKEEITTNNVISLMNKYQTGSPEIREIDKEKAKENILERFSEFSFLGILLAGLLDGFNPCAFATLIFFVSYLLFVGRRRKEIILMAIFFIAAVFLAYFSIGVGAYNLLKYLSGYDIIARVIFLCFGVGAVILGILSLRDFVIAKKGQIDKMILQLPLGIKQRIHKGIREKTAVGSIIFGSFIAGFVISFLEFGCTGQVYLPTITFMISKVGWRLRPILSLLAYNIMFIIPLIVIASLAILFSTRNVAKSLENKIPAIKFLTAILFFVLGVLLILSV